MRKLILLLMLSCGALSMQAQGSLKQQVENGIQTSIRQTQNQEWSEAFATCRALDATIGKGNPDLHYLVSKERFRMYSRINKPNDARSQMEKMENYARESGKADVIEDMLIAKGNYSAKTGNATLAMKCYKEVFNSRAKGKDDEGIDKCFQSMVAEAKGKDNALMASMLEKMYTQWKDSIASDRAAAELKAVKAQYAEAQEDIDSKATKIAVQWGFIIVLIVIAVGLALALAFFVMLKFKNMVKIKHLKDSLEIANNNNDRKSLFINNISEQINPSLDAIARGDKQQVVALQNCMQHIKEYMVLENSREDCYEQTDLNMERLCKDVVAEAKDGIKSDLPIKMDAHGITFPSNEEALKQLLVALISELAKSKDTERISLEFKKRNPHTGNFIVTGIGFKIPADKRENIFQAFAEIRDLTVDDGMKLPTCALMAYKLNGNLRLDEEFAQGTRFVVELHC